MIKKPRESRENRVIRLKAEASVFMNNYSATDLRISGIRHAISSLDRLYDIYTDSKGSDPQIAISLWRFGYDLRKFCKEFMPEEVAVMLLEIKKENE